MRRRIFHSALFVGAVALCLGACGKEEDTIQSQISTIESALGQRDYDLVGGVYKHVENRERAGRDGEPTAVRGDSVEIYFEGYVLTSSLNLSPTADPRPAPFYTNREALIAGMADPDGLGLSPEYWSSEVLKVKLGSTPMIPGLATGIPDSHRGDSLLLFFPSDMAYGGKEFGTIPKNSPIVFRIYLDKVNKQ